ncbi:MAG: hypothetical protein ACLSHO_08255 [Dysosmobacter sp.]
MSGNAKRNLVVGTMAVLVCAAVGLNWKYSTQEALQQAEETGTKILGEATLVSGQGGNRAGGGHRLRGGRLLRLCPAYPAAGAGQRHFSP